MDPIVKAVNPHPCNPFCAFQTYHTPSKVPSYVEDAWKKFASEYDRYVFNDEDMRKLIVTYFQPRVVEKFDSLQFPHKADLWRYCALYIYGGLYADIKTELVRPLSEVIEDPSCIYVVKGAFDGEGYYNGFIYSPMKENPLLYELIEYIVNTPLEYYHMFCVHLETVIIRKYCKDNLCKIGYNETAPGLPPVVVLKETNDVNNPICQGTLDRYGFCVYMVNGKGDIMFKTRYHAYPWH